MNAKTQTPSLNQNKPKPYPNGRDIIKRMKMIKAEAEERMHAEIDRLFMDRLQKPDKSDEENRALYDDLEKTQTQLLEQEIRNNPELAGCFYKKPPQEKQAEEPEREQAIKAARAQYDQELIEKMGERHDQVAMISRICCVAGIVLGALVTLLYLAH